MTYDLSSLIANPLISLIAFFSLSLLPFATLGLTSFLKFSVVLSILRNALGAGQVPGAAISSLIALMLTIQVMSPVLEQTTEKFQKVALFGAANVRIPTEAELTEISKPWRNFLLKHAGSREIMNFRDMAIDEQSILNTGNVTEHFSDFSWLVPAFILTELKEAFIIGFALFIPFIAIDLIVTNLLVGLGMMMVSPNTIALPLKILLFISCDGWLKLSASLISGYR